MRWGKATRRCEGKPEGGDAKRHSRFESLRQAWAFLSIYLVSTVSMTVMLKIAGCLHLATRRSCCSRSKAKCNRIFSYSCEIELKSIGKNWITQKGKQNRPLCRTWRCRRSHSSDRMKKKKWELDACLCCWGLSAALPTAQGRRSICRDAIGCMDQPLDLLRL